ncbi:MAG: hypothetical protein QM756_35910 [Polyangiaceae bacterium]
MRAVGIIHKGDWFFVEQDQFVQVFEYPSLKPLLRREGRNPLLVAPDALAFARGQDRFEVWGFSPKKLLAERVLPAAYLATGAEVDSSSVLLSLDPGTLRLRFGDDDWTWRWQRDSHPRPPVSAGPFSGPDELPGAGLLEAVPAPDATLIAESLETEATGVVTWQVRGHERTPFSIEAPAEAKGFAVSPSGARLVVHAGWHQSWLYDLNSTDAPRLLGVAGQRRLSFFDDDHVVVETSKKSVLVDVRDSTQQDFPLASPEHFVARGSSGVIMTRASHETHLYSPQREVLRSFFAPPVAWSPSGEWVLLRDDDKLVLASRANGTEAVRATKKEFRIEGWRFTADESKLVTFGDDGILLWDCVKKKVKVVEAIAQPNSFVSLAFAVHDSVLVLSSRDTPAVALRLDTGERLPGVPEPEPGEPSDVVWLRSNGALRAYDARVGRFLATLGVPSNGGHGWLQSEDGHLEFFGERPKLLPRCAFGNALVAWEVCEDVAFEPGLVTRIVHGRRSTDAAR